MKLHSALLLLVLGSTAWGTPPHKPSRAAHDCLAGKGRACLEAAEAVRKQTGEPRDLSAAAQYFQRACDADVADGCHELALLSATGELGVLEDDRASALLQQACDQGRLASCGYLASRLLFGFGVAVDPVLARVLAARSSKALEAGCKKGVALDCDTRAFLAFTEVDGKRAAAFDWWKKAAPGLQKGCKAGRAMECRVAGLLSQLGNGVKADAKAALGPFERGCALGDAWSCQFAAGAYQAGLGVEVNLAAAASAAERGCARAHEGSCRLLATLLKQGEGVAKDEGRSATLFAQADVDLARRCERRDGASCWALRWLRANERTTPMDEAASLALDARSLEALGLQCATIGGWSCQLLAWDVLSGHGAPQNIQAGVLLEKKACADRVFWSCNDLGEWYLAGERVAANESRARWYFQRACELGLTSACAKTKAFAETVRPVPPPAPIARSCLGGQLADDDEAGQCCWPGQVFSSKAARCVGVPSCPAGLRVVGESCQCASGQVINAATQGHCCWEGQRWGATEACEGTPSSCPATHWLSGNECVPLPACNGGLSASQQTQGRCCWPGQRWSGDACVGAPSSCPAEWVASGEACVPGLHLVWPYLSAAVRRAALVEVPKYSEFDDGRVRIGGWDYLNADTHLEGPEGCVVTIVEQQQMVSPDVQDAITPTEIRSVVNLDRLRVVAVNVKKWQPSSGGSWTVRTIDGRQSSDSYSVYLGFDQNSVRAHRVVSDLEYDEAHDRDVRRPHTTDSVESGVIFDTSLRGAALEAARAFLAAGKACGAGTKPLEVSAGSDGYLDIAEKYDGQGEQRELENRTQLQRQAWSQGRAELQRAQAATRSANAALVQSFIAGLQQSQAQINAWNQTLTRATGGLAVVPAPVALPPPAEQPAGPMSFGDAVVAGLRQAEVQNLGMNKATAGGGGVASTSAATSGAGFSMTRTPGCDNCQDGECKADWTACQSGSQSGCYRAAACICRCQQRLGGCGTSASSLAFCVSSNTERASQLHGSGTTFDPSTPKQCVAVTYPQPQPTGDNCTDCRNYWQWKNASCRAQADADAQTPQNYCHERASAGAYERCDRVFPTDINQCSCKHSGAGVAR